MERANYFQPHRHSKYIECHNCNAKNSPTSSQNFSSNCYSCGKPLNPVEVGSVRRVDIIDERDDGKKVGKTDSGLIIFIEDDVIIEATVEITEINKNYALGTVTNEEPDDIEESVDEDTTPSLGKRSDFH